MLADRGAHVVGVEPGQSLFDFAMEQETVAPQHIRYVQADLSALPDLGVPFDAVVASMVLPAIPDWTGAMRACVHALKPNGLFVFTVTTLASTSSGQRGATTASTAPTATSPSTRSLDPAALTSTAASRPTSTSSSASAAA